MTYLKELKLQQFYIYFLAFLIIKTKLFKYKITNLK